MKKILFLLFMVCSSMGFGQVYDTIRVGYSTSVNMIFETPILRWDMGLGVRNEAGEEVWDVLVAHSAASANRIKLAAGIADFQTTNLFVETEDGYYNFILLYTTSPKKLLLSIDKNKAIFQKTKPMEKTMDSLGTVDNTIVSFCNRIYSMKGITDTGYQTQKMLFYLGGIYISEDHLYFRIHIKNEGTVKYDIGYTGFLAADKGKQGNKRRPRQEEALSPVHVFRKDHGVIQQGEEMIRVYVFRKFTLDPRKNLYIQFREGNGGERKADLVIKSKDLLEAVNIE